MGSRLPLVASPKRAPLLDTWNSVSCNLGGHRPAFPCPGVHRDAAQGRNTGTPFPHSLTPQKGPFVPLYNPRDAQISTRTRPDPCLAEISLGKRGLPSKFQVTGCPGNAGFADPLEYQPGVCSLTPGAVSRAVNKIHRIH